MAKHNSAIFIFYASYVPFILACIFSLSYEAVAENPKPHIVYMGSLPKRAYSPTSHHLSMLQQVVGVNNSTNSLLIHSYKRSFNGFAAMLTDQQREKLSQMEGVISVFPSRTLQTLTTRSWDFMGFAQSVQRRQTIESDTVIGIIDSGIWPESESFNDQGFGSIPKKWKGTCAGGTNFTCNKKIIGARIYVEDEDSARDDDGHGTHTASTAAGNIVYNASYYGLAEGTARGAVPSARIAVYKVCAFVGCNEDKVLAAFDDAIADGVDIISISLGGDHPVNFEVDGIAIGSFHAMGKGILTVNSAGNNGPRPSSVHSVAPWILTVAASTTDRQFIDKVVLGNGKTLTGNSINSFTSNGTKFPIVTQHSTVHVKGKIVLCDVGSTCLDAYDNGAIGAILGIWSEGDTAAITPFPLLTLYSDDYDLVKSYTNSTKDSKAEILKSEVIVDPTAPDVVEFSSRGPNKIVPEILKPDICAPGVNILAAYSPIGSPTGLPGDDRSVKYNILSGTSMSCPHVAGIATYLKSFHLDWSPAAIKSAIMTTAQPMKSNSTDYIGEYAYGSGHINPVQAINPGLIYDIGKEDYIQMFCNLGYDNNKIKQISGENSPCIGAPNRSLVRNLNYPSLTVDVRVNVSFHVTLNRTVTNVGLANSIYRATILPNPTVNITVAPEILSFKSLNEKQSFVVAIVGNELHSQSVLTSSLTWSDGTHNIRSPIVVNVS